MTGLPRRSITELVKRTGFIGVFFLRDDGAHGSTNEVLAGAA